LSGATSVTLGLSERYLSLAEEDPAGHAGLLNQFLTICVVRQIYDTTDCQLDRVTCPQITELVGETDFCRLFSIHAMSSQNEYQHK